MKPSCGLPSRSPRPNTSDRNFRFNENLFAVARLRPEATLQQANAYLHLRSAQEVISEGQNSYGLRSRLGHSSACR